MRLTAQEVYDKLVNEDGILQLEGQIKFYLGDVNIIVKQRDVVGNIMQEWLQGWLDKRGIYDIIIKEADAIVPVEKLEIESKLILSMAIRLKSDEYMIQKISSKVTNGTAIINDIYQKRNQSAWLYKEYKKNINDNAMEILEQVAMLTPENIHLNSFMFEPILDMSLLHLYDLYQEVKNLLIKNAVITP